MNFNLKSCCCHRAADSCEESQPEYFKHLMRLLIRVLAGGDAPEGLVNT